MGHREQQLTPTVPSVLWLLPSLPRQAPIHPMADGPKNVGVTRVQVSKRTFELLPFFPTASRPNRARRFVLIPRISGCRML